MSEAISDYILKATLEHIDGEIVKKFLTAKRLYNESSIDQWLFPEDDGVELSLSGSGDMDIHSAEDARDELKVALDELRSIVPGMTYTTHLEVCVSRWVEI